MRRVPAIVVLLLGLAAVGCRNTGSHELLERELRLQEDKIGTLQYELEKANQQLQDRCRETMIVPPESDDQRPMQIRPNRGRPAPTKDADRSLSPPDVYRPSGEAAPQYKGPPLIQPPDPNVPEGELPRRPAPDTAPIDPAPRKPAPLKSPPPPANLPEPQATNDRVEELTPPPGLVVGSGEVSEIALNHELTGRRIARGAAREDSVVVVVEPRTADGRLVQAAGAISIVVLDLSKNGPDARLARWNFSAEEALQYYRDARQGGGMHFELRWPGVPPQASGLQLFVRLTTPDGRKLVADAELTPLAAKPTLRETGHLSDPAQPGVQLVSGQLVSGAEPLSKANWRRSRRPLPRADVPQAETSLPRAEPSQFSDESRQRRSGEPRRLPDDVLSDDGAMRLDAAVPLDASGPPRDSRAWAPYR